MIGSSRRVVLLAHRVGLAEAPAVRVLARPAHGAGQALCVIRGLLVVVAGGEVLPRNARGRLRLALFLTSFVLEPPGATCRAHGVVCAACAVLRARRAQVAELNAGVFDPKIPIDVGNFHRTQGIVGVQRAVVARTIDVTGAFEVVIPKRLRLQTSRHLRVLNPVNPGG